MHIESILAVPLSVCRSLPCTAKGTLSQGQAQHLGGGGRRRHGPGLFNKLEHGCRCTFFRLQLLCSSAAPSQCLLLPPALPADQSVHVLLRSLQAPSAARSGPLFLAPAVLAACREGSSSSSGRGGQHLGMGPSAEDPGKHSGPWVRAP